MSAYTDARDNVSEALAPIAAYCQRAHDTADASDPALAGKFRHVTQLEAAVNAVVEYGAAVEAELLPPSARIASLTERIRNSPAYQNAAERPDAHRAVGGQITSHCLILPLHARPEPL